MKRTAADIFKDALALPAEARAALPAGCVRASMSNQNHAVDSSFERDVAP
jgi:hypothetical protein